MKKRLAGALLTLAAVGLELAPSATASPPIRDTFDDHVSTTLTDICPFPIHAELRVHVRDTLWLNQDGVVVKITDHVTEHDVFSAHGHSITTYPYHYTVHGVFDKQGNLLHAWATGTVVRMRLLDGTLFNSAGRVDALLSTGEFTISPDMGHSGDIDAFCAALS